VEIAGVAERSFAVSERGEVGGSLRRVCIREVLRIFKWQALQHAVMLMETIQWREENGRNRTEGR
jgi:hypothetical protein